MKKCKHRSLWVAFLLTMLLPLIPVFASAETRATETNWLIDYIAKVPPILMKEPFLELLGQTNQPVPYTYNDAVKIAGHSCGAVAGAWIITRKALESLYPGTLPVRGQIMVTMPGSEDEWYVGVFAEVISYITGAAPKTGFPGAEFGQAYNRRNLITYKEKPTDTPPAKMVWIFERKDNGAKVAIRYDLSKIMPPQASEQTETGAKVARGQATPQEAKKWREYWNARVKFVFDHADTLPGLFTVEALR
jgi:hypothetical protein